MDKFQDLSKEVIEMKQAVIQTDINIENNMDLLEDLAGTDSQN